MLRKLFAFSAALLFVVPAPARAQFPGGLEIEPYGGAYVPLLNLVDQDILGIPLEAQQKSAFALGGRVTYWLPALPLAIEGNFMYAFSDAQQSDPTETADTSAYVYVADARLALKLLPVGPVGLHVTGGIALIGRGGDAYVDVTEGKTDVGGVVGLGLRLRLPGTFAIRADGDVFVYSAQVTIDDPDLGGQMQLDSQVQGDLVLSAGLIIGFL